jgi:hypothetical protein
MAAAVARSYSQAQVAEGQGQSLYRAERGTALYQPS